MMPVFYVGTGDLTSGPHAVWKALYQWSHFPILYNVLYLNMEFFTNLVIITSPMMSPHSSCCNYSSYKI